jgi:hypothetical protein
VLLPRGETEQKLVERLAEATWRHIRIFRAQARFERFGWRRLLASAGKATRLTARATDERAFAISQLLFEGERMLDEAYELQTRIKRILGSLLRERWQAERRENRE